jgi:ADP-ribose pyrophosphatase
MTRKELRVWKTVSRRTILQHSRFLTVESHTVKLPDGRIIDDWAWLIIPSAVIVLAVTDENKFLCFRQTKYAIQGTSLAPVGGMLEPGETPLLAAKRELLEELGCQASEWVHLGSFVLEPNRGIATNHLFLALNARKVAEPHSDDLEEQELVSLSRAEIEKALQAGGFKVLAWVAAVALALNYLKSKEYSSLK